MMKLLAFLMAITSIPLIQSCDEDDPTPAAPTVTAPSSVATVQIGTTADVTFTFEAPGGFESSEVAATGGTATIKTNAAAAALEGSVVVEFTAGITAGVGSVTLTITDAHNQSTTQTATLNISLSAPPTVELSSTAVSGTPGGTVEVTVTINAPNGAESLTITGATTTPPSPIAITGTSNVEITLTLNIPSSAVIGSSINVFFTATDAQDLNSTATLLTISVTDPLIVLEGEITADKTLDATEKYLIRGKVYVKAPAKLTIPAGTILFGEKDTDGTLIINRGAQIDARGTAANPIIFTSQAPKGFRNRGDWGGLVILGKAYNSNGVSATIEGVTASAGSENGVYGPGTGADPVDTDNSGFLQYVRIEYAGIALSADNELNSLTMGSVGSGTTIDHIMVSYANDDAYEWFGGAVNHKFLVAYSTNDDDFDTDRGYIGKVQFGLVVRDNGIADFSGSKAWESSSLNGTPPTFGSTARHSAPVFSHITVLGPRLFGPSIDTDYKSGFEVNQNSAIKVHNSIITGFATTATFTTTGSTVTGNVFAANGNAGQAADGAAAPAGFATDNALEATVTNIFGAFTHKIPSSAASNNFYSLTSLPNAALQAATSPYLTGAINLSADAFFENVEYKGAFGTAAATGWNYSAGWVNFNPNETNY